MDYFKKGTLVFVHTSSYPPWPAQVQRKYENGLYKVNFIGQKSYTRIEQDKMDLFTEQRAKQIHSELQDKKLSKAIFVALKQFQNRKKKGEIDQDLSEFLKRTLPPLDLSMYKSTKSQTNSKSPYQSVAHSYAKFLPSNSSQDNLEQIGKILDKIYDFIILPVQQKMPQYLQEGQFLQKKMKIDQQLYKLKQLLIKQQQTLKSSQGSNRDLGQKESNSRASSSNNLEQVSMIAGSKKQIVSEPISKQLFMDKLIDTKIVQKLIMTVKAYQSFRDESQKQFGQTIEFLKQRFAIFYEKFKEEYNKKKLPSHKDRIMLQKFENFQAYL